MTKRSSSASGGSAQGLGSIVVEVLSKVASPEASQKLIQRALTRARLTKMPEDPVVLLAFASGALREAADAAFGEEMAEELLGDLRPILERAAAHAVAMEAAEDDLARNVSEADLPVDSARASKRKPAKTDRPHEVAPSSGRATEPKGKAPKSEDGKAKRRRTLPHGKAATSDKRSSRSLAAAVPKRASKRTAQDPRRATLPYGSTVQGTGQEQDAGLPLVVVVDRDEALRSTLARMLRREGCAVVTAPDGELGLTLCERVLPRLVMVEVATAELAVRLSERFAARCPPIVVLVPSGWTPTDVRGAERILPKPVTPERLLSVLEAFLPDRSSR
jgi:CheY-like chemotaxis protein